MPLEGFAHAMAHCRCMIGNSSAGIREAALFGVPVINIGDRQKGRIKAESVIDCEPKVDEIVSAIKQLYNSNFKKKLESVVNPYGNGGAAEKIVNLLKTVPLVGVLKKQFYDLSC